MRTKQFQMKPMSPGGGAADGPCDTRVFVFTKRNERYKCGIPGVETEITGDRAREVANGRAREDGIPGRVPEQGIKVLATY